MMASPSTSRARCRVEGKSEGKSEEKSAEGVMRSYAGTFPIPETPENFRIIPNFPGNLAA